MSPPDPLAFENLADALLAEAVRESWMTVPTVAGEEPSPRLPVATWDELARESTADRGER